MVLTEIISPILEFNALTLILKALINQYLLKSFCITIITEYPLGIDVNLTFIHITPDESFEEFTEQVLDVTEKACSDYIVNMKDPRTFLKAYDKVTKLAKNRRGDRKMIILPAEENEISLDLLKMRETLFVANVLVILKEIEENCEVYDFVTHQFMEEEGDDHMYLDKWNSCTNSFENNNYMFPHSTLSDLKGKTMKVAACSYLPYTEFDLDTSLTPTGRDGIEIRLVEEFCKWINCTIEIVRDEEHEWGELYDNGTGVGILGNVYEDRADIGISSVVVWQEVIDRLDYSASIIVTSVYCVAPAPRILSSWTVPFKPFTWTMWCGIGCAFVVACFGLAVAEKGFDNNIVFAVFAIMISQSPNLPSTWRVRGVTGWLLTSSLILVSAYGAGLAATFTVPTYEPSIDTIEDMVERDMAWGAPHEAWIYSLLPSTEPQIKKLVSLFRFLPPEELERRSFTRDLAFSFEALPGGLFGVPAYLTEKALVNMEIMADKLYFCNTVGMFRKSSPYVEKISELIGKLHQSGLLIIWERQVSRKYMDNKKQQIISLSRSRNDVDFIRPLCLSDVMGVFMIYGFGLVVSVLVFLAELLITKIENIDISPHF